MGNYDDIINLPHHESTKHPKMPALDRAAQFSPFAALTGHDAAVKEAARLTDARHELDENRKNELDDRLQILRGQVALKPTVSITYFVSDTKKEGGAYHSVSGTIEKLDEIRHEIILGNGTVIPINTIYEIDSPVFDYTENP